MPARKLLRITASFLFCVCAVRAQDNSLEAGRAAFEKGDYSRAVEILKGVAAKDPSNGDAHLFLARSYLELHQTDSAVGSAEKAMATNPKNSDYHRWLGEAYSEK